MIILGIETSCDETGAALVEKNDEGFHILSNEVASSLSLHAKTGGIIPETAAREQLKFILPVIQKAVEKIGWESVDAIAVTYGPGLIGSLLVGVETAKTFSYVLKKPIIPVNHLYGHIYANWIMANGKWQMENKEKPLAIRYSPSAITFPALALVVSGGHTDLVIMQNHEQVEVIGGTRDDAAGEAFDKIGRLIGLPYPAGPMISKLAEKGDPKAFDLPRPMIGSDNFDFSFSGLKTAALKETKTIKQWSNETMSNFCASVQHAIVDVLVKKTIKAAKLYKVNSILLGGGVAANQKLREEMELNAASNAAGTFDGAARRYELDAKIFAPAKNLCIDNAAMIAAAGFFAKPVPWQDITADPELYY